MKISELINRKKRYKVFEKGTNRYIRNIKCDKKTESEKHFFFINNGKTVACYEKEKYFYYKVKNQLETK